MSGNFLKALLAVTLLSLAALSLNASAQLNLGGALDKAKGAVEAVTQPSAGAAVPSGAVDVFKKVDQSLEKAENVMGDGGANYDNDYRAKEAAARLLEAKEGMETAQRRYGSKMGADHPEFVSRLGRIAALEPKIAEFQSGMNAATQQKNDARDAAQADEAAQDKARQEKNAADMAAREAESAKAQEAAGKGAVGGGKIVFSKSPIDPANPAGLTTEFQAGDYIYGLILPGKSWRDLYGAGDKSELGVMVGLSADGNEDYQYITLKKPEYIDAKHLVLEIAPDPAKMTSYKDPDMLFGEGKGNRKIGPIAFTYDLAQLAPGKHTVKFFVRNYGDHPAVGEMVIEGADFSFYADLHEKVKAAHDSSATMPPAGMVNKELESQMRALLENAGWTGILRVVIVDKDWWIEDGGASRYLNVAAAARDGSGKCYWCNTQFTQPRLIDGSWGKLELTKTGIKRDISEENVNK